jgi:hypothetical protein
MESKKENTEKNMSPAWCESVRGLTGRKLSFFLKEKFWLKRFRR